jgi:hypothetical protein
MDLFGRCMRRLVLEVVTFLFCQDPDTEECADDGKKRARGAMAGDNDDLDITETTGCSGK